MSLNEFEIKGIRQEIREIITEELEGYTQSIQEQIEALQEQIEALSQPNEVEDEEVPLKGYERPIEHQRALDEARELDTGSEVSEEHMKKLQNVTDKELGRQALQKGHRVKKEKDKIRQFDPGFDNIEQETEEADLGEYEETN